MNREYTIVYPDDTTKTFNGKIELHNTGEMCLVHEDAEGADILVHCYAPGEWKEAKLKDSVMNAEAP